MKNVFEFPAFAFIGKDDLPHLFAVQHAGVIKHIITKGGANLCESRCALCDDFTRDYIGIDDRYAKICEDMGDGRFAAGNATSEPDSKWSVR